MEINIWSQEEAKDWFEKIEKNKGRNESEIIDWKEKLNLEDTSLNGKNNTTQRAMSGFANTFGGYLVIGFSNDGEVKGINVKDLENRIIDHFKKRKNTNLNKINYKIEYYTYKEKNIPVIFIQKSKEPIQCDNGVFYYREQTQFLSIPYYRLEDKFKGYFDENKYLFLLKKELKLLEDFISNLEVYRSNGSIVLAPKISNYTSIIFKSKEKLYNLFSEHNMWQTYFLLIKPLYYWVSVEGDHTINKNNCITLLEKINGFSSSLEKINI